MIQLLPQDTWNRMLASAQVSALGVDAELDRFIQEAADIDWDSGLSFWQERGSSYPLLARVAEDLVSAPTIFATSQAYVEHVFSACGHTCACKRNRASGSLECRVFLKMNGKLLHK